MHMSFGLSRMVSTLMVASVAFLSFNGCKPRRSDGYGVKSGRDGGGCVNDITNRIESMGIRVEDAGYGVAGARVACVEDRLGLHVQYGLKQGDVIVALNRNTPVGSAADFEEKLKALEADFENPIPAWEFVVDRGGQRLTLAAKPEWEGCIPESFNRCGSVGK